jgi:hypothetical protein
VAAIRETRAFLAGADPGLVAVVGVVCASGLVDWSFVTAVGMAVADEQDIVNLLAFLAVSAHVGLLANRRCLAQLRADQSQIVIWPTKSSLGHLGVDSAASVGALPRSPPSRRSGRVGLPLH